MPRRKTVIALLADANIIGHVNRLWRRMQKEPWAGFWSDLQVSCVCFSDVGLDTADSDAVVWRRCQERLLLLITSNRNNEGPDSLQNTIATHNDPQCLPVFTLADPDRILVDNEYSAEVIWILFEYLYGLNNVLGAGRLYLP
jgi:hypothetical protein